MLYYCYSQDSGYQELLQSCQELGRQILLIQPYSIGILIYLIIHLYAIIKEPTDILILGVRHLVLGI